jgi:serralysin
LSDIEALNYLASNNDLRSAYGSDINEAKSHYENYGFSEGRVIDNFDELAYVAIHTDLMNAFGSNVSDLEVNGLQHYLNFGIKENRRSSADVSAYINENGLNDLFFEDPDLVKRQYISDLGQ